MTTDDYYGLLGIEADASTDDIRDAYRVRKADLEARDTPEARAEVARLNKAWNTLSDPYQRGRYDEHLAMAPDDEEGAEAAAAAPAPVVRRRGLFGPPPEGAATRPPLVPTIPIPEGATLAESRPRVMAMAIDLSVLILLFMAAQATAFALIDRWYPEQSDRIDAISEDPEGDEKSPIEEAKDEADDLDEKADDAEQTAEDAEAAGDADAEELQAEAETAREAANKAEDEYDTLNDELSDLQSEVMPATLWPMETFFAVGLLYLVVPSALAGVTLGKRMRGVRVIRADGSPLGWGGAFVRYGPLAVVTNLLFVIGLGPIGGVLVLVAVLGWMRNPNRQGMHDRLAKTLVVDTT